MFSRLTSWCFRRRRQVLLLWIVAFIATNGLGAAVGNDFQNSFSLPGTESQEGFDILTDHSGDGGVAGFDGDIVFRADAGIDDPAVRADMEALFAEVLEVDLVASITSPYDPEAVGPPQVSEDRSIAYAKVIFEDLNKHEEMMVPVAREVAGLIDDANRGGLQVEFGGAMAQGSQQEEPGLTELLGLFAAVLILLVTFASVLAMGLPLLVAVFGISIGLALLTVMTHVVTTPQFAPQMASMIGIGVGIDYALLIVTRFRQGLADGHEPEDAATIAMGTAGRSVIFAGITVVISMLGILLMGFEFVEGVAIGGALVVLVTMLGSVTLLPAMLGFAGHNVDKWRLPGLARQETAAHHTVWYRWSRTVQKRPWLWALASLAILVTLSLPAFKMRLGVADTGNDPVEFSTRRAYDLLAKGFGPGFNGPFLVVAETGSPADLDTMNGLSTAITQHPDVAAVSPAFPMADGKAAMLTVIPKSAPQDAATFDLVGDLRDDIIPKATEGTSVEPKVTGFGPVLADFSAQVGDRLPILIGVVIVLSFLLLMLVFRSVLVPLKAAIMNLLSIGAAYGVIVAIFQWGWGASLIGIGREGPIEAWAPMMLFAILFGLSMDYEVFLLSRVSEEYHHTGDNATAVANGLARTARVITAAAAIMITVFMIFALGSDVRQLKLFAIGLAVAILVDATLVRTVLVPSTMELLGNANWWLPSWLDRLLPHIHIEDEALELAAATVGASDGSEPLPGPASRT